MTENIKISNHIFTSSQTNEWIMLTCKYCDYNYFEIKNNGLNNSFIDSPIIEVYYNETGIEPKSTTIGILLDVSQDYKTFSISPYYLWVRTNKANASITVAECIIKGD